MMHRPLSVFPCFSWALLVFAPAAGCATLDGGLGDLLFPQEKSPQVSVQPNLPPNVPTFTVELRAAKKEPAEVRVALERAVYVQDALDKSGAAEHFRRMDIELLRPLPDGRYHRLEVHFDRQQRRVEPAFDYALHPNDRLMISENTSTVLDDMLHTITEPLGVTN